MGYRASSEGWLRLWQYFYRSRIRERAEHLGGRLPYVAEAVGKDLGISIPQLDVIASGRTGFKSDGVANDECGCLGFGFADSARGAAAAIVAVEEFMRQFMGERGELFRRRLAGKKRDAATARRAACGRDAGRIFDRDSLRLCEAAEPFAKSTRITLHDSDVRQFLAVGLCDIEYVGSAKTRDRGRSFFRIHFGLGFATNDGSKNQCLSRLSSRSGPADSKCENRRHSWHSGSAKR